jgi:uridine kinase
MQLIDELSDLCNAVKHPIIAIDGPAGAGKTTLALHIAASLPASLSSLTIHMDDLYNGWTTPFDYHFTDALSQIVKAHCSNSPLPIQKFNWTTSRYETLPAVNPSRLLILEGCGAFEASIREFITVSIWLDIDAEVGMQRVLGRDGDSIEPQMRQWLDIQKQHFLLQSPEKNADYILTT